MIGIYKIKNLINDKVYIGQSWDIELRWRGHKSREYNSHLRSAFEKYGIVNFEFTVLREFTESPLTDILLTIFEQKYMDEYEARAPEKGYNFKEAGPRGKHSEESKRKVGEKNKLYDHSLPEHRTKMSIARQKWLQKNLTHPLSEETKQKISRAQVGKRKPMTEDQRKKHSQAMIAYGAKRKGKPLPKLKGHFVSEETRQKMSLSAKRRWKEASLEGND
jgi:group I intron endonuclease